MGAVVAVFAAAGGQRRRPPPVSSAEVEAARNRLRDPHLVPPKVDLSHPGWPRGLS